MIEFEINLFFEFLKKIDGNNLPGLDSQIKMAPRFNDKILRTLKATKDAKLSSVLIPLIPKGNSFQILLTLRSSKLNNHSGQISFPGGRMDENESPIDTALRETHEEVGISKNRISVLNNLTELFVPPTISLIYPVVGILDHELDLVLSEDEVEEVILLDFEHLINGENLKSSKQFIEGYMVDVPYWDIHPTTKLWGATAMILSEFIDVYNLFVNRI